MRRIYIGNLPYKISKQELQDVFGKFGDVEDIALIKDRNTGLAKGFGFITFGTDAAAQSALSMNGQEMNGRALKVSIAKEREEREGGGRGDFGGRR